jgi:hypothetical protein
MPIQIIEIILPAGTERVTVRDIPELFATAIIPEVPEGAPRQVIELKKMPMTEDNKRQWCGEGTRAFPVRLTAEDMKMLWAGMPPLQLPIDVGRWQPYADVFALAGIVDWELRAITEDPALARLIVFADVVEKRKKGVRDAAQSGVLTPRSPRTFMPDPDAIGETLQDAFVTVENLREYAARDGIIVSVQTDTAHSGTTEKAAPDVAPADDEQIDVWKIRAREIANDIWLRMLNLCERPTKEGIAKEIARRLWESGVVTTKGKRISDEYVLRFALRNGWEPPDPD